MRGWHQDYDQSHPEPLHWGHRILKSAAEVAESKLAMNQRAFEPERTQLAVDDATRILASICTAVLYRHPATAAWRSIAEEYHVKHDDWNVTCMRRVLQKKPALLQVEHVTDRMYKKLTDSMPE